MCRIMAFFRIFGLYLSSFVIICISIDRSVQHCTVMYRHLTFTGICSHSIIMHTGMFVTILHVQDYFSIYLRYFSVIEMSISIKFQRAFTAFQILRRDATPADTGRSQKGEDNADARVDRLGVLFHAAGAIILNARIYVHIFVFRAKYRERS